MSADLGEHVDLLVPQVELVLEFAYFGLQGANTLLQGLGVAPWKGASTELVAGATFEADGGALRTARSDAVAANLLASTSIAGLGDAALSGRTDLDHLHREDARHRERDGC